MLLIGAGGFAGAHMRDAASLAGFDVVGTSRREGGAEIVCDLLDSASTDRAVADTSPDVIVNLAGVASVAQSFRDVGATFRANTTGVTNLLASISRAAREAYVLCVSSGEVYGSVDPDRLPIAEEMPTRPSSPYAASKVAMELVCEQFRDAAGLRICVARAFNHTGPGQAGPFAASSFARQIAEAEQAGASEVVLQTGDLTPIRDFLDVRDVVDAYRLLAEREIVDTLNVCSGRGIPISRLIELLGEATSLPVRTSTDPALARPAEASMVYGSAVRLRDATGWEPHVPLAKTLRDLLDWWRARMAE